MLKSEKLCAKISFRAVPTGGRWDAAEGLTAIDGRMTVEVRWAQLGEEDIEACRRKKGG